MRPRFVVMSALALGFISAKSVHAEVPGPNAASLPVVGIASEDAHDQAAALTQALRSSVRASQGWSLPEREYSLEVLSLTLGCGDVPDVPCQRRIADEIQADRYVWGTMRRVPGSRDVIVDLNLFERELPGGTLQLRYADNLVEGGDEILKQLAASAIQKLTGGAPRGTLQLKAVSSSGQIFVDGQAFGTLQEGGALLRLAPGEHRVEVHGDVGLEMGTIVVRPNETVQLVLGSNRPIDPHVELERDSKRDWRPIAGWVGVGVGGGLVLGGVVSALQVSSLQDDYGFQQYRSGFAASENVCDAARAGRRSNAPGASTPRAVNELCDKADTYTTLQYVFFGTGVAAIGVGAYFLISSALDDGQQPTTGARAGSIAVLPSMGPGGGALDLHMTF